MPAPDILPQETVDSWFGYRLTPEMRQSLIPILADPICELLGLEDWSIDYTICDLANEFGPGYRGQCLAVWTHKNSTIRINVDELDLGELVETLFHEHLHLLLGPMEQMAEMEGEMYQVDPASRKFIENAATYFLEQQIVELRTTLGKRLFRMLGINTHDWLMTLAIRHLEEKYDASPEREAADSRAGASDTQHRHLRTEGTGDALRAAPVHQGRAVLAAPGARTTAARDSGRSWRRPNHR